MKEKGAVKKRKQAYPSKTTINLLYKEKDTGKDVITILLFLVFLVLLAVFTKLMVIDQLAEVNKAERQYQETKRLLDAYKEANKEYSEVEEEYSHYANEFMTEEEVNRQDRAEMLKVIDEKVKVDSGILNIQISFNTATLTIEKTTLAEVSSLVAALESSPIVEYVAPSTAATNTNTAQVDTDGKPVKDNSVKAVIVVQFKSMTQTALDVLDEAEGSTVGEKISNAVGKAVSGMVDDAATSALGETGNALRNRRELPEE